MTTAAFDVSGTLKEFPAARTLPAQMYTSGQVYALEQQHIFSRMWLNICRMDELPRPGDFITRDIGNERILVVRDGNGEINAFYNVCRHRGTRLVEEAAGKNKQRISCPYHGWTYAASGELINAPLMGDGFCPSEHNLVTVRLEEFEGFIFINLDPDAEPLSTWLSDLPDLGRFQLPELVIGHRECYEVDSNWKFIVENYSECYHCALNHPQLNRITDYRSGGNSYEGRCFNGGPMTLNDGFTSMSMSGKASVPSIPGLTEKDHKEVHYYCIYPNLLLSPHAEYVLVHTLWPVSANKTEIICDWLFTKEAVAMENFSADDMVEFWDVTNKQDWDLCERAQRGAVSRGFLPGPYNELEECIYMFDHWYAKTINNFNSNK